MINTTLMNSMGVVGKIVDGPKVTSLCSLAAECVLQILPGTNSEHVELRFDYPELIWPYCKHCVPVWVY